MRKNELFTLPAKKAKSNEVTTISEHLNRCTAGALFKMGGVLYEIVENEGIAHCVGCCFKKSSMGCTFNKPCALRSGLVFIRHKGGL